MISSTRCLILSTSNLWCIIDGVQLPLSILTPIPLSQQHLIPSISHAAMRVVLTRMSINNMELAPGSSNHFLLLLDLLFKSLNLVQSLPFNALMIINSSVVFTNSRKGSSNSLNHGCNHTLEWHACGSQCCPVLPANIREYVFKQLTWQNKN